MNMDFQNFYIRLAYNEGVHVYYCGKRREDNIYDTPGHEDRAAAWFLGWDHAQKEDLDMGNNAVPPNKDEP